MGKYYITTAIDYPNSAPHMGHAYEKTLADFHARWHRQRGDETWFLTGLDEHGEKIQEAARGAGLSPREFTDEKAQVFRSLLEKLAISNDDFLRTSEPRHHRFASEIWGRVQAAGDIYLGHYEGEYCISCESFYTATQLVDGKCPVHGRPTERLKEESYFFRLGKHRDWIRGHIREHPEFIFPEERRNEILSRLEDEIRDLSISRSTFDWGIPVPGDPRHVLYVWFDALSNYISALREPRDLYGRFWPADLHVIGKDIIWFHTVIWPCMLRSAGLPLPRQVFAHGFILDRDGKRMSKHLGNVVDPLEMIDRHGAEVLRFYLLRSFPGGGDGRFSEEELLERYHGELGNDLGNLVMRIVKLVEGKLGGTLEAPPGVRADLDPAPAAADFERAVEALEHHRALESLWSLVRRANAYLNERAPWKESDPAALRNTLYNGLEALRGIAYLLSPAMPTCAAAIARQLGTEIPPGPLAPFGSGRYRVRQEKPLFPRRAPSAGGSAGAPEPPRRPAAAAPAPGKPSAAPADPFALLDIRVGLIEEVREHPDADALWVMVIDIGGEKRTICAGLRRHLEAAELQGRKVAVLANLKPARLRGIESQGMVLATDRRDGKVAPVDPGPAAAGDRVVAEGIAPAPKERIAIKDFEKAPLLIEKGRVVYGGRPLRTPAGELRCDAEDGARVR